MKVEVEGVATPVTTANSGNVANGSVTVTNGNATRNTEPKEDSEDENLTEKKKTHPPRAFNCCCITYKTLGCSASLTLTLTLWKVT